MTNHRKYNRLKGYDYAQEGAYFVTVCTQGRKCLLGDVVDTNMVMNDVGTMVLNVWEQLHKRFAGMEFVLPDSN